MATKINDGENDDSGNFRSADDLERMLANFIITIVDMDNELQGREKSCHRDRYDS